MIAELSAQQWGAALDRMVQDVLAEAGVLGPPVDAIDLAWRLQIDVVLDHAQQPRGRQTRFDERPTIFVRPEERPERLQWAVAHELGETMVHRVFRALDLAIDDWQPQDREELANRFASNLLLPRPWFLAAARERDGDLLALKKMFGTASHELIAWRLLDLPVPTVITLFDQGCLTRRRGNSAQRPPRLQPLEHWCWRQAAEHGETCTIRQSGLAIQAWPVHEGEWRREFVRTRILYEDEEAWFEIEG